MSTPQTITEEIQKLAPESIIELFELDTTSIGGDIYYFHSGTTLAQGNIVWQTQEYAAFPIEATGFEFSVNGQLPRPKLKCSNIFGSVTSILLALNDLLGAKLTRRRTMKKYLDAVNFTGGVNPDADATADFPDDIYFVDRKSSENKSFVELELASAMDLAGVILPHRQTIQNVCPWVYKGTECGYSPGSMFDANDVAVTDSALDVCGKRLSSCKVRFGATSPLSFGSFPSIALIR